MDSSQVEASLSILEERLESLKEDPTSYDDVFPMAARCLYFHLAGQDYMRKYSLMPDSSVPKRALEALHEGIKLAIRELDSADALCMLGNAPVKAKFVAERTFEEAISYDNNLDDVATSILQRLRDDFMAYEPVIAIESSDPNYIRPEAVDDGLDEVAELFAVRFDKSKVNAANQHPHLLDTQKSVTNFPKIAIARKIRRGVSLFRPVIFESLTSAASMLKALDSIFRAYIRGNALPGQLAGGNAVDFAGQTLTFRSFILNGPYLSWKGFLCFLLDFNIAKAPARSSKVGKSFYRSLNASLRDAFLNAAEDTHEPLMLMVEAAVIFIEAAQSLSPALVMNKFVPVYAEMARNPSAPDSWNTVVSWAEDETDQEWEIPYGLNFMQFVDCIGKMGLIGYSAAYFNEMLPSVPEKMSHFLSAFLGLTDRRKWHHKVERKLQAVKRTIALLTKQVEEKPPKGSKSVNK
eukprot:gene39340-47885_t